MSFVKLCRSLAVPAALGVLALGAALAMPLSARAHEGHSLDATASGVKDEVLTWIKDAETKLIELAETTPEGKYSWRPAKGVRSTGEVFMHVAAANYGLPGFAGVKPPEGFDFATYEKSKTKKADIVSSLRASFDHMEKGWGAMSNADLDKPAEFFGMKTTARGAYLLLLSHCHEHLGQSIAYARSNGVVPPWTARQEAAMAKQKMEKGAAASEGK
jgi:uncharacterized damage-inducible protein DinB